MKNRVLSIVLVLVLLLTMALPVFARNRRLVDDASLLTGQEAEDISILLDETSEELSFDIIIVTVDDHRGDVEIFTENYYDDTYGSNHDGVILLLSMEERDMCISGCGEGKDIFTSSVIDNIFDAIADDLSNDEYYWAFETFVEQCVYYVEGERNGYPMDIGKTLLIAAALGLVVAFVVTLIFKSQLKSVRRQPAAENYVKPGSMKITNSNDIYLYRIVNRVRRSNESSSGGHSSGSHSTGSRKF